jgi:ectoine hydroxylase-related dioxygenase (phytanoyl-CoA dioxygenase family)
VDVSLEMGPLAFSAGSHRFAQGRDLAISDESEMSLKEKLAAYPMEQSAFALGDVSFHSGWTFHRAGPNRTERMREVFTIIYMDQDIRLIQPRHKNHEADRAAFAPGIQVGEVMASELNPVLYSG